MRFSQRVDSFGVPIEEVISEAKSGSRYFHCADPKVADAILRDGYSHRKPSAGTGWDNRFLDDWQWFCYYHLFFPALDAATVIELQKTLHDESISQTERGTFMRKWWEGRYGDDWCLLWVGKDKVFPAYGCAVLEFTPSSKDFVGLDSQDYYAAIHVGSGTIPGSQFKLVGTLEPVWAARYSTDEAVPFDARLKKKMTAAR